MLFLLILSCRWWWILRVGSSVPLGDQWEELKLFKAYLDGSLDFKQLFAAHNEHRIFWSRLFSLLIFELNDQQWDNRVWTFFMAGLTAFNATLIAGIFFNLSRGRFAGWILSACLIVFCLPFAWMNMVWGFQTQFQFQILFAILTFYGIGLHSPGKLWWWIGGLSLFAGLFTSGSGFFAGLSIAFVLVIQSIKCRRLGAARGGGLVWLVRV